MAMEDILELISTTSRSIEFKLLIEDSEFLLSNVKISKSTTPVHSPTLRGGVYFSDKIAYKMKGTINDLSVIPLLTKVMLGPNTEFHPMRIHTSVTNDNEIRPILITTHLTNSMQGSSHVELTMIVVDLQYTK